ncbi:MAG: hypothetical protein KA184_19005 [Candidatus Hydrogenedentes bacterium]|nr:hypothetical protein [Candidatus Hydrogenedentota bacterium]
MRKTMKRFAVALVGLVLAFVAVLLPRAPRNNVAAPDVAAAQPVLMVNGRVDLTTRPYDKAAYVTTHNAMSSRDAGFIFPNQIGGLRKQLEDGVRAMMLDVHEFEGRPMLCHSYCELGGFALVDGLVEIREFLDAEPNEVVTLILESYVPAETLALEFADSGILRYAHVQSPGEPWPTLGRMVLEDQRLVVFTDDNTAGLPWLHNVWRFAWDTNWNVSSLEQFNCNCSRGDTSSSLMILNNFVSNPLPAPGNAEQTNASAFLLDRSLLCWERSGRIPNFVTVDYYEVGDVFAVVDRLNSLAGAA